MFGKNRRLADKKDFIYIGQEAILFMAEGYGNRGREYDPRVLDAAQIPHVCPIDGRIEYFRSEFLQEIWDRRNEKPIGPFRTAGEMLRHMDRPAHRAAGRR